MSENRAVALSASFVGASDRCGMTCRSGGSFIFDICRAWSKDTDPVSCNFSGDSFRLRHFPTVGKMELEIFVNSFKGWHVVCLRGVLIKEPFEVGYRLSAASFCLSGY